MAPRKKIAKITEPVEPVEPVEPIELAEPAELAEPDVKTKPAPRKRVSKKEAPTETGASSSLPVVTPPKVSAVLSRLTTRTRLVDSLNKANSSPEHIVVQLALAKSKVDELIQGNEQQNNKEDPVPYIPDTHFVSAPDNYEGKMKERVNVENHNGNHADGGTCCFWCCHPASTLTGMPIKYDVIHDSFELFGTFCSLECAAAYNFSVHSGSDRAWDIYSWIQILGRRIGCTSVRPAPNKYLLNMFGGPLAIQEFRTIHKSTSRTAVMNMPPFINIMPQMEMVNTSYLSTDPCSSTLLNRVHVIPDKQPAPYRENKTVVDFQKTLDSKMNLSYKESSSTVVVGSG